ncbi:MAG: hypothetical protein ACFBSD_10370 [Paracoccaceae bacterium]
MTHLPANPVEITPEYIDMKIAEARRLRAVTLRTLVARLFAGRAPDRAHSVPVRQEIA